MSGGVDDADPDLHDVGAGRITGAHAGQVTDHGHGHGDLEGIDRGALGRRLRGVGHGPDLEVMQSAGLRVSVVEDGPERGFCLWGPGRVVAAGGTGPEVAQRALWAGLGSSSAESGETEVHHLTADQQWAVEVVVGARLAVRPGESSCRRGALGPMTPYLPTGAYG